MLEIRGSLFLLLSLLLIRPASLAAQEAPIVTNLGGLLPGLIGGSVIIETIFSLPGLGFLSYQAVLARDYPVVLALFSVSTALTLVGILISDVLLVLVDPRISFRRAAS